MKYIVLTLVIFMTCLCGCSNQKVNENYTSNMAAEATESLKPEDVIVGRWILYSGGKDDKSDRIYVFYESGLADIYIGYVDNKPGIGCYEIDNNILYFNMLSKHEPRKGAPMKILDVQQSEITLDYEGNILVWKKY